MFDWMDEWYKPGKFEEEGYVDTVMMLASWLKELADKHEMVDVGYNTAKKLGVTQTALNNALLHLEKKTDISPMADRSSRQRLLEGL